MEDIGARLNTPQAGGSQSSSRATSGVMRLAARRAASPTGRAASASMALLRHPIGVTGAGLAEA
jgi:hypothetical protein